jgi:hypothetical protein
MSTPTYHYPITNRHGIPVRDWTEESRVRLREIARTAGADLAWNGCITVSTRAQLDQVIAAVVQHGCEVGEYPEWDDGDTSFVSIETLERYGSRGWEWTVRWRDYNFESGSWDVRRAEYRTSHDGDGLWLSLPSGEWKQLQGTCQYSLPASEKAARKAIMQGLTS